MHRARAFALILALLVPLLTTSQPTGAATRIDPSVTDLLDEGATEIPVILHFGDRPTDADGRALLEAGFLPGMIRYRVIPAVYAVGPASAVREAVRNPRVTFVEHDAVIPWSLDRAVQAGRAEEVWDATYERGGQTHAGITGDGIGIAVVDSGVDATHPDLLWKPFADAAGVPAKTTANYKIEGRDSAELADDLGAGPFLEADQLAVDVPHSDNTGGHGTHVAGIAAGNGSASGGDFTGAAPDADLIGYGAGEVLVIHMGLAAFDHIHLHHEELGIRVVNNSWGGAGDWDPERAVTKAAQRLVEEDGLAVVFAAGNSGGDGETIQSSVWGNIPGMIQVANYYDRTGWLDATSSRGKRTLEDTWPDLAAPGTQIISTAATGGPVSYFGSAQDALIKEISGYDEPVVVPAQSPVTVRQEVAGDEVIVGNYASLTGTSMAAPFVSGVIALILEANPDLSPAEVREILRETANMPEGRSYETDGFAVGKGVVDAAEAVAVALRTADGTSLDDALRTAYVDHEAGELNLTDPRTVTIEEPAEGDVIAPNKKQVKIKGAYTDGPLTDQSIPLAPDLGSASPLTGQAHIYQGGAVDPFLTGGTTVLPGEPVSLSVRSITSSDGSLVVGEGLDARHLVTRGGTEVFEAATTTAADTDAHRTDTDWTVPPDAEPGEYLFEGFVTVGGVEYRTATLSFSIGASVDVAASAPGALGTRSVVFEEGFEGGADGWAIEQNGTGPGVLTEWSHIAEESSELTWAGHHDGDFFQASLWPTAPFVSGVAYTDLADTSLVSPPIDLAGFTEAEVSYWRAGASETDFDVLQVYAEPEGGEPVLLEERSGDLLSGATTWEANTEDLADVVGGTIRLRFRFVSDEFTAGANLAGWGVDEVAVAGTQSGAGATLTADPDAGLGTLDTTLTYGAALEDLSFALDFGDGSPVHEDTEPGNVAHTYGPGSHTATLTVSDSGGNAVDTATTRLDVVPVDTVQLRLSWTDADGVEGSTGWVEAPRNPQGAFNEQLSLDGVPSGQVTVEARHVAADGRRVWDRVEVTRG